LRSPRAAVTGGAAAFSIDIGVGATLPLFLIGGAALGAFLFIYGRYSDTNMALEDAAEAAAGVWAGIELASIAAAGLAVASFGLGTVSRWWRTQFPKPYPGPPGLWTEEWEWRYPEGDIEKKE